MNTNDELKQLQLKIKNVITTYCDSIGCKDCPVKYGDKECEATILQGKEMELLFP